MKLSPKELRQLYASGGLALCLIGLGAGGVWWAQKEAKAAQMALQQADLRASDIRHRLRQVNVEEQEIRARSTVYHQLEARRIIGPEQRLDWIELIDRIREQRRLFEIEYEITPQKADGPMMGDFQLNTSEMSLHLPLLHEGDLIGFTDELQRRAPALVQIRHCEIQRATGKAGRQAGDPNLDARCELKWTTIARADKNKGQP